MLLNKFRDSNMYMPAWRDFSVTWDYNEEPCLTRLMHQLTSNLNMLMQRGETCGSWTARIWTSLTTEFYWHRKGTSMSTNILIPRSDFEAAIGYGYSKRARRTCLRGPCRLRTSSSRAQTSRAAIGYGYSKRARRTCLRGPCRLRTSSSRAQTSRAAIGYGCSKRASHHLRPATKWRTLLNSIDAPTDVEFEHAYAKGRDLRVFNGANLDEFNHRVLLASEGNEHVHQHPHPALRLRLFDEDAVAAPECTVVRHVRAC